MCLKKIFYGIIALLFVLVYQSCTNSSSNDEMNNTSRVQLKLVDAPGDYLEVNIEIIICRNCVLNLIIY